MKPKEYIQKISKKFSDDHLKVSNEEINGINTIVGYKTEFRWSWFATKLHIFGMVGTIDKITKQDIDKFSKACIEHGERNMKGMRGMQQGAVSFAVLASDNVQQDAIDWVKEPSPKHFALMEFPVIYDLKEDKLYYCEKTPMWGAIYFKFFRNFVKMYFR